MTDRQFVDEDEGQGRQRGDEPDRRYEDVGGGEPASALFPQWMTDGVVPLQTDRHQSQH